MVKKILITGGCGYIGSHVTAMLLETEYALFVIDDFSTGCENNKLPGVHYIAGDIGDQQLIEELLNQHQFDTVIHLAAKTSVEESNDNPELYYLENTQNTLSLISACAKYQVKNFLFSSTAAVYSDNIQDKIDEESPIAPISPYGKSKYAAELFLQDIAKQYGINCIIFRYFNVAGNSTHYGVGSYNQNPSSLIQKIANNILNGNLLVTINGNDYHTEDGTCVRDYIHVMDIANAHLLVINYLQKENLYINDVFNIGYGTGTSVLSIYQQFKNMIPDPLLYTIGPRREADIGYSVANSMKIQKTLGWRPLYEEPLAAIINSEFLWRKRLKTSSAA